MARSDVHPRWGLVMLVAITSLWSGVIGAVALLAGRGWGWYLLLTMLALAGWAFRMFHVEHSTMEGSDD